MPTAPTPTFSKKLLFLDVPDDARVTTDATEIGNLVVGNAARLTAPALKHAGTICAFGMSHLKAPVLVTSGDIVTYVGASITAEALTQAGEICIERDVTLTAPSLTNAKALTLRQDGTAITNPGIRVTGRTTQDEGSTWNGVVAEYSTVSTPKAETGTVEFDAQAPRRGMKV